MAKILSFPVLSPFVTLWLQMDSFMSFIENIEHFDDFNHNVHFCPFSYTFN